MKRALYRAQGKKEEAKADFMPAIANSPNDDARQHLENWLKRNLESL